ncbi:MAG TPA: hypothetical protein VFV50_10740 [Bdellovibrionales bacterium]|nr:hypothetical protein [Bdellovibrionales bacterium]
MKIFQVALLGLTAFALLSCGARPTSTSSESEDIRRAYQLIDDDRASDAIVLLEPRFSANPGRVSLRIALASAYAARAGLRVPRFADLLVELIRDGLRGAEPADRDLDRRLDGLGLDSAQRAHARTVLRDLLAIAELSRRLERLPHVSEHETGDLRKARELLEPVPNRERGAVLYRAVLAAVDIKYELRSGQFARQFTRRTDGGCEIQARAVPEAFNVVLEMFELLAADLMIVYPENIGQLRELLAALRELAGRLERVLEAEELNPRLSWPCSF